MLGGGYNFEASESGEEAGGVGGAGLGGGGSVGGGREVGGGDSVGGGRASATGKGSRISFVAPASMDGAARDARSRCGAARSWWCPRSAMSESWSDGSAARAASSTA